MFAIIFILGSLFLRIAGKTAKIRTEPAKISCRTVSYKIAYNVIHNGYCPLHLFTELNGPIMYQSIPVAPRHPGYCGAFARPVSPGDGAFANFALPGGQAFANPGGNPELLPRTQFLIRI